MKKQKLFWGGTMIFIALLSFQFSSAFADIVIKNGSSMKVSTGTSVVVSSNVTIETGATLDNDGTVSLKGGFTNNGTASLGSGTFVFNGTAAQEIGGSANSAFEDLTLNNSTGLSIATGASLTAIDVNGTLTFTDGQFDIEDVDLTVGSMAGYNSSKYVVQSGSGELLMNVALASSVDFPVGYSATNYNPVVIANPDAEGLFNVRVADGLLEDCTSGTEITEDVVTVRWHISPVTATEADITLGWNASDEGTDFDNTDCSIIHCEGGGEYAAVGGFGDGSGYSLTGTGITDFSTFGIGDARYSKIYLDLAIMLQGPYAGGGTMTTTLNSAGVLPLSQPYSNSKYDGSHLDYDGTESIAAMPATVVDWVLIELRTGTDASTSVGTVAALLLNDGSVAYYSDGSSVVPFEGETYPPGDYYIALHHRNHLSILTSATVTLNRTSTAVYDFTTGLSKYYTDSGITNDPANNNSGVYMMWAGDANFNGEVRFNGANKDLNVILAEVGSSTPANIITNVYSDADVNMNNEVKYNGANKDNNIILSTVGSSTPSELVYTHVSF
jgi:hypothetical protein